MLRRCALLAVLGCALAAPQHQYQPQQAEPVPPHLLRQYIGQAQQAQGAAVSPTRLPYSVQSEDQYQQPQSEYRPQPQVQYRPQPESQPQYRPQPQQYRPQPQYQHQQRPQEEKEDYDPNPSYQFGFDVSDDQYTNYQNRKEQRDGDVIKGSYSVVDSDGFIRTVTYTADPKEGFKAEVSRQPTDIVVKIPTPKPQLQQLSHGQPIAHARPQQQVPQYYRYEQQ